MKILVIVIKIVLVIVIKIVISISNSYSNKNIIIEISSFFETHLKIKTSDKILRFDLAEMVKLPDFYKRYVDDTFSIIPNVETAEAFLSTLANFPFWGWKS